VALDAAPAFAAQLGRTRHRAIAKAIVALENPGQVLSTTII
jgi:hypothetical protein